MGLDIHVDVLAGDILTEIDDWKDDAQRREARRVFCEMEPNQPIHVRTGSYHGLHLLRQQYAKLKGWPIDDEYHVPIYSETQNSHLVNHSDCEGYYLPDDFPEPQWITSSAENGFQLSVGSSVRLLAELSELLTVRDNWPEDFGWRWDNLFAAAFASVVSRRVIRFS